MLRDGYFRVRQLIISCIAGDIGTDILVLAMEGSVLSPSLGMARKMRMIKLSTPAIKR